MEILQYNFFINALLSGLIISVICGIIGTYIVSKNKVFIAGGITHASFGGIGLGYYLNINPLLSSTFFAVAAAFIIDFLSKKIKINQDSMIGIVWSTGMALGIILVYLTPGYTSDLMTYLFGNILTVSKFDLYLMLVLCVIIVLFFILFYKKILFICFDEDYAILQNLKVNFINASLTVLTAFAIISSIRIVGIILVISLLTIPQNTSKIIVNSFNKIMVLSVVFNIIAVFSGLFVSYHLNIPSGASIIFCSVILYSIIKISDFILKKC